MYRIALRLAAIVLIGGTALPLNARNQTGQDQTGQDQIGQTRTMQAPPQTTPTPPAPPQPPAIVVMGVRDEKGRLPTESAPSAPSPVRARRVGEKADQFLRCIRNVSPKWLAAVVDGNIGTSTQVYALDRIIRQHRTCYPEFLYTPIPSEPFFGECNPYDVGNGVTFCQSYYDRGALFRYVLRTYAPDLALTSAMTDDRAVQVRFNQRETARNARRQVADYAYFEVAVCVVRLQPEASVRLALSEAATTQSARSLLNRARACVGNAKNVTVDPAQFRDFIADAVYRWALAAQSKDSFIPTAG